MRGTVGNSLKEGGTEKRGEETKILKRGQAGSRGSCLKKGAWNPLKNYGPGYSFCFCISNDLTQMVNFPTWIPGLVFHSPAL